MRERPGRKRDVPGKAVLRLLLGRATGDSGEDVSLLWKLVEALRGAHGSPLRAASPGCCGAVRSGLRSRLAVSRVWRPGPGRRTAPGSPPRRRSPEERGRGRARDRPVSSRSRAAALSPGAPAAGPGATGSAARRGAAPRDRFVLNGRVARGRGASGVGTQEQKCPRAESAEEQAQPRENFGEGASAPANPGRRKAPPGGSGRDASARPEAQRGRPFALGGALVPAGLGQSGSSRWSGAENGPSAARERRPGA